MSDVPPLPPPPGDPAPNAQARVVTDPPDTYGLRIKKYQRREQMATWVVAGIAALGGFIAAHALDGAPHIFVALAFSVAIVAGAAAAFTRVGFEWQATLLKRAMTRQSILSTAELATDDQDWPGRQEWYWRVCLLSILVAWIIMAIGIWWPRASAEVPKPPADRPPELHAFEIGSVGPFGDCKTDMPATYDEQIDRLAQKYRDDVQASGSTARAALIILMGLADNRRLTPACAKLFGSNENIAITRARNVQTKIGPRLLAEQVKPSYVVLTSGPRHLEAIKEGDGRQEDRAVEVWLAIDRQVQAPQKLSENH